MLGSVSEADDAVQESWLRLDRSSSTEIDDLRGWLTTVVARICLDILRARRGPQEGIDLDRMPELIVTDELTRDPEQAALIADSVGVAMLVVLETLSPAERVAFVLHDVFGVPFDEVAPIVGRTPTATRQLASRARRRVRTDARVPEHDVQAQRRVVDAFLAASRAGDFDALVRVLDPGVVMHVALTSEGAPTTVRGADDVARHVLANGTPLAHLAQPVLVNGAAGLVVGERDEPISVAGFTIAGGLIIELDLIADPARIRHVRETESP
jgi:RNA polymerase sigma-70 factor (ECF subfamily)